MGSNDLGAIKVVMTGLASDLEGKSVIAEVYQYTQGRSDRERARRPAKTGHFYLATNRTFLLGGDTDVADVAAPKMQC